MGEVEPSPGAAGAATPAAGLGYPLRVQRGAAVRAAAVVAFLGLALFGVPALTNDYWVLILMAAGTYAIVALGLAILVGRVGMISLGQVALLAVGGWVALRLGFATSMPFPLLVLVTGLITGVLGTLIGLPALRLSGLYLLGDREVTRQPPERVRTAGVAIVPEGRRLLPDLTVADNLRVATYALSREDAWSGVDYALELFPELKPRWDVPARSLSGGEQQMVVLAQAVVSRPTALLVDELSLGLAPVVVKRLVPMLESVARLGVGVLLVEQFAHVALSLANTVYVLEGGRVRYHGTAAELRQNPDILRSAYLLRAQNGH